MMNLVFRLMLQTDFQKTQDQFRGHSPDVILLKKKNDEKSPEIYDDSIPPTSGVRIS